MHKKTLCILMGLLIIIIAVVSGIVGTQAAEKPEQHVTVAVKKLPYGLSIDPIIVKRGEPIIWVNHDPEPMKIKILTKIELACANPVNFYSDLLGYYESIQIPKHAVASLCIIDKGEYRYEVHRLFRIGDNVKEEVLPGKIIVE